MDALEVMESMRSVDVHVFIVGTDVSKYTSAILAGALAAHMVGPDYVWMFPNNPVTDLQYNYDMGSRLIDRSQFHWIGSQKMFSFAPDPLAGQTATALRFANDWAVLKGNLSGASYAGTNQDDFSTGAYYDCMSAWTHGLSQFLARDPATAGATLQRIKKSHTDLLEHRCGRCAGKDELQCQWGCHRDINANRAIEGASAFICPTTVIACLFIPKFLAIRAREGGIVPNTFNNNSDMRTGTGTRSSEAHWRCEMQKQNGSLAIKKATIKKATTLCAPNLQKLAL